jgi:hypothetical protein
MITNIHKNRMGTVSFDGKFDGMRKAQDFIVYPMHAGNDASRAKIQSDTRIGAVDLNTGAVILSPSRAGGSYGVHMALAKLAGTLSGEELLLLKAGIFGTAHGHAGSNGIVYTDNSAAVEVFGRVQA